MLLLSRGFLMVNILEKVSSFITNHILKSKINLWMFLLISNNFVFRIFIFNEQLTFNLFSYIFYFCFTFY